MTADQLYRLHAKVQRAREALDVVIAATTGMPAAADLGDPDGIFADLEALGEVEDTLFEAWADAVRREVA